MCVRVCLLVRLKPCRDWSGLEVKGQINTAGTLLLTVFVKAVFSFFLFPTAPPSSPPQSVSVLFCLTSVSHVNFLSPSVSSFSFATFFALSLFPFLIPPVFIQSSLSSHSFFACPSFYLLAIYLLNFHVFSYHLKHLL